MKKNIFLTFLFIFLMMPLSIRADINSSSSVVGGGCRGQDSCWQDVGSLNEDTGYALRAVRVTIFNEKAERVSDTVDISINSVSMGYGVKRTTSLISKIEYIKGETPRFEEGNLDNLFVLPYNSDVMSKVIKDSNIKDATKQDTPEKVVAKWFEANGFSAVNGLKDKLQYCGSKYASKCKDSYTYYAVFEPTTSVIVGGVKYYGTAYELAFNERIWNAVYTSTVIRSNLPNALYITGKDDNGNIENEKKLKNFYSKNNANIGSRNGNYNIHKTGKYSRDEVLKFGVGIGVFMWKHPEDQTKTRKRLECNINVNMVECGDYSIRESTNKECIVDNDVYSYIKGCNLYCSDEITTNFNGFYGNFRGNNVLGAIKSGKYLAIKSNPKITIKKTCYQSEKPNECPNVIASLESKLKQESANKIYLTVDGRKYNLIGNKSDPIITLGDNDKIEATITYEYKLDENINKYIDIGTMKGILNPSNKDKTYTNDGPMIITSKATFGKYKYSFDVSETPLNKYTLSSSALRELKNTGEKNKNSSKYDFINNITINYTSESGSKKDSYTNDDLKNTTCTYIKYNTDDGCICKKNECCDSVTCEPVECPPPPDGDDCTCTGEYGCYDDGKCTPIPPPPDPSDPPGPPDGSKDLCDPEKKVCFPNIIYRPISLIEPFPGIKGDKRTPGNNWNKVIKTTEGKVYSYGDYYIRNRRGYKDYEIYQAEPLYVIKLDGAKIQEIRTYNDKHNYNDFELTCINGENCVSKFLRGTAQDFSTNLIDGGTCKNITSHDFNSCIKNKGD